MDWMKLWQQLKKYRWPGMILLLGVCLLAFPTGKTRHDTSEGIIEPSDNILSVEEALSEILSLVQGAGKVRVMLTVSSGEETLYQSNQSITESGNEKVDTVIISDSQRSETGLVKQIIPPVYLGAIVLCQGADSPAVRLSLVEAISKVTGLSSDKISILKMK